MCPFLSNETKTVKRIVFGTVYESVPLLPSGITIIPAVKCPQKRPMMKPCKSQTGTE